MKTILSLGAGAMNQREHAEKLADQMGIRELAGIIARLQDERDGLVADLKAVQDTLKEVHQSEIAKHAVIQEWREGLARIEHMAQAGRAYTEPRGPNSPLQQIIDEPRRLRSMPA